MNRKKYSEAVENFCNALGIDYEQVVELHVGLNQVEVVSVRLDKNGKRIKSRWKKATKLERTKVVIP